MRCRLAVLTLACCTGLLWAATWSLTHCTAPPAERGKLRVSAVSQEAGGLQLHWVRQLAPPRPAWPDQTSLQFDAAYRPVPCGDLLLVGSARTDSLTALDAATGEQRWRFFTNGPIRLAPCVWRDRVYFVCDDGYLYCLAGDTGALLWKFRGGPSDRLILGNERLISTWPARGAPVVADGVVYFAAGIWPFMGIFVHALDAETGRVVWTNDGDGSTYRLQPHHADSFAGVAPQGTLAVAGDLLLVSGGRSVPACFDRRTGKLVHFRLADNGLGGWDLAARGKVYVNGGALFESATGDRLGQVGQPALLGDDVLIACGERQCQVFDLKTIAAGPPPERRWEWAATRLTPSRSVAMPPATALARDGNRLYVGAVDQVFALDLPLTATGECSWRAAIEGTPLHIVATNGRLVVSTRQGRIYSFGMGLRTARRYPLTFTPTTERDGWTAQAANILAQAKTTTGWCLAWGAGSGRLVTELARQGSLRIVTVEPDAVRAETLRDKLLAEGILPDRVAVLVGAPDALALPPYCARLIVAEEPVPSAQLPRLYAALRPYGGTAWLPVSAEEPRPLAQAVAEHGLVNARVRVLPPAPDSAAGAWVQLTREGPLPGAADWTHEHADAANTRVSRDQLVKAPLGVLWFGGPSHEGILPRHGHGPQPQVIDGKLIIEGPDLLRALDIYTGVKLWETRLAGVGQDYDETWHQPGANASGANYVSTADGIYIAHGRVVRRLDPETGQLLNEFPLPRLARDRTAGVCRHIKIADQYLVCAIDYETRERGVSVSASKHLAVLHRQSGKLLWTATAKLGFRHNTLCLGGGRLYCIDRPSTSSWSRRGETAEGKARLVALDLKTGKELWSSADEVFGTWLSYSTKHDVLVEAGLVSRDTLWDEADGMRAWNAARGAVLWRRPDYRGPAMIHGDLILKDRSACHLLTGAPLLRPHPLTGMPTEWTWTRDYGCNTPLASQHLLTFRSGAAGYFDLARDGGTGNFGGFRSGCTNNLIVAGGVLVAPDYTRTCTCSYQNQTSLALAPMPEAEMWTYHGAREVSGTVRRVGINLGAPGNRRAPDGTLWLEWPRVGGPSYRLAVTTVPAQPEVFRRHTSWLENGERAWVAASGVRGLAELVVPLADADAPARRYTVRLHFVEPDGLAAGQRVFDVALQGRRVLQGFDVSQETGGARRAVVKEFRGVRVERELKVTFAPAASAPQSVPVLCGIEIVAEGW
ncbi:MAG: PQQ-binding-like beta-propeller repeat protein [Planctomycetia bacterium]|nr:PQQ-binding-like beta-propeller repeat protein [Planctomycetia bacterium]